MGLGGDERFWVCDFGGWGLWWLLASGFFFFSSSVVVAGSG